jgi:hypothetical protein
MAIEFEFFTLTGMEGNTGETGILQLKAFPTTGPSGEWDIGVDPVGGPAQVYSKIDGSNVADADFGITGTSQGLTGQGTLYFDDALPNSTIRDNLLNPEDRGITGPLTLRVIYNY